MVSRPGHTLPAPEPPSGTDPEPDHPVWSLPVRVGVLDPGEASPDGRGVALHVPLREAPVWCVFPPEAAALQARTFAAARAAPRYTELVGSLERLDSDASEWMTVSDGGPLAPFASDGFDPARDAEYRAAGRAGRMQAYLQHEADRAGWDERERLHDAIRRRRPHRRWAGGPLGPYHFED